MNTHAPPDPLDTWPAGTLEQVVVGWLDSRHRATRHTYREVAAGPLPEGEPVPGCTCLTCAVLRLGGSDEDVEGAERVVDFLADLEPNNRTEAAVALRTGRTLPPARILVRYAAAVRRRPVVGIALDVPVPRRRRPTVREPLPVEQAREVPILKVVEHLGLGSPRKVGREYAIHCFLHEDRHPSLSINAREGLWYCHVCAEGGDVIRLWECARRVGFVDAVRELVT